MTTDAHTRSPHGLPPISGGTWPQFEPGWVWLAGAGPGDPGLLTLHALNALNQADVIIYDALIDPRILDWANPKASIEYAGKRGGKPSPKQRDITLRLIELTTQGKRVLRLKGGDPFVFGRGGEEAQTLVQAGVPIRILPGISAGIGGLAYAGIPVTHRDVNQAVTFLTGHDRTGMAPTAVNWKGIADGSQVIVMYMAIKHLPEICDNLITAGRNPSEPVAVVTSATWDKMEVLETTLAHAPKDVADHGIEPPAIICVGEVVRMRQCLDWIGQMNGFAPRNLDPLGRGSAQDTA
ncbi:MAG: uroporphyrinogen-III C-methyltransferase [Alphaproteobacteria bacterium]|nr:uroporphyrinogen-III C-methyltransferase [Alphaproteobacteria bacterium]